MGGGGCRKFNISQGIPSEYVRDIAVEDWAQNKIIAVI